MIDGSHIEDQAAARALGALPPEEEQQVDEHVDICPSCRSLLLEAQETANLLALTARPALPPRRCKLRVMELIERETFLTRSSRRSIGAPPWARWVATAAVAVALFAWNVRLQRDLAGQRELLNMVMADPQPKSLRPQGNMKQQVLARMFMTPEGKDAVLVVHNLDPAPAGKVYQVWLAHETAQQPMETFQPDHSPETIVMHSPMPLKTFKWVMITVENAGGSKLPSKNTVLFGDL